MKKIILLAIALSTIFISCQSIGSGGKSDPQVDSVSTALGQIIGADIKRNLKGIELNLDNFSKGFNESYNAGETDQASIEAANAYIQNYMMNVLPLKAKQKQADFITELEMNTKLTKTESGLFYEVISEGDVNLKPTAIDTVKVNYRGTLIDGEEFESSYSRNEPITFPLNGVIKGWTEGIQLIGKGGKIMLYIPSELAYGEQGQLANQLLTFEVELLDVTKGAEKK